MYTRTCKIRNMRQKFKFPDFSQLLNIYMYSVPAVFTIYIYTYIYTYIYIYIYIYEENAICCSLGAKNYSDVKSSKRFIK